MKIKIVGQLTGHDEVKKLGGVFNMVLEDVGVVYFDSISKPERRCIALHYGGHVVFYVLSPIFAEFLAAFEQAGGVL